MPSTTRAPESTALDSSFRKGHERAGDTNKVPAARWSGTGCCRRKCFRDCRGPCCQPMSAICGRQRSSKAAALFGQNGVLYVRFSYQTATDSAGRQLFLLYDPKRHGEPDPALTAGDTLNITVTNNPQSTDTPAPRTLVVCSTLASSPALMTTATRDRSKSGRWLPTGITASETKGRLCDIVVDYPGILRGHRRQ